ncbi:hypothetical protein CK203_001363 [Vitis vinifera]|uniref:Uncharacterized protein n=1 Tax=Vitis vinifera TaxID=29760 RepID=A0A438KL85_VITVI|nr:hypothetical protein CK203_075248 [Vitis vinifera]RVX21969.1 hypothetical protein CK203_001363 [Vitis vinifera]
MAFSWLSFLRITFLLLLIAAIAVACFTLPVEKVRFSHLGDSSNVRLACEAGC